MYCTPYCTNQARVKVEIDAGLLAIRELLLLPTTNSSASQFCLVIRK